MSVIYVKIEILKPEFTRLLRLNVFLIAVVPTVPVIVNGIIECSALINTGVEFNMMIVDVADRAGLAIRTRVKVKMSSYSEYISRFLKIIENVLISVDLIVCRVNIFVTRLAP